MSQSKNVSSVNIVNVGYDSANYYVIGQTSPRLLVDAGWPKTLPRLLANLKRKGIALMEIGYFLATHYHPDHAGLAQELVNQGVRLVLIEPQVTAIELLKTYLKPGDGYVAIQTAGALRLAVCASRAWLASIGIAGQIIATSGHSADSITLVLDEGIAFTGDLPGLDRTTTESAPQVAQSWQAIRALKVGTIYPGHGPPIHVENT